MMKLNATRSSGNIFRDIGFSRTGAGHLNVRAGLLIAVQESIAKRGLTQAAAAKLLRVHPPRVSDLMRGRIDLFSVETLIDMLAQLGVSVKLVTGRVRKSAGAA